MMMTSIILHWKLQAVQVVSYGVCDVAGSDDINEFMFMIHVHSFMSWKSQGVSYACVILLRMMM